MPTPVGVRVARILAPVLGILILAVGGIMAVINPAIGGDRKVVATPAPVTPVAAAAITSAPPTPRPIVTPSEAATTKKPEKTATPKPSKKPSASRSSAASEMHAVGVRYACDSLNVRSSPSTSGEVLFVLDPGSKVVAMSVTDNGFRRVSIEGRLYWATEACLRPSKPPTPTPSPSATKTSERPSESPTASPRRSVAPPRVSCSLGVEAGLVANAIKVHRALCAAFPWIKTYGGVGGSGYHAQGRALDAMTYSADGWPVASWLRSNASRLGVSEVIYAQKIWTVQRSSEGWRWMSDRGGTTANHYDHVHVSVY
jgi:hypothetical protein